MPANLNLIREIVAALVHLKDPPTGVPPHGWDAHGAIRREYERTQGSGSGDPLILAAEGWLAEKLSGLVTPEVTPAPLPEPSDAPQPTGGGAEQGIPPAAEPETPLEFPDGAPSVPPSFATVENGGVALHDKPLGELTDAELESLTAPDAPREGE